MKISLDERGKHLTAVRLFSDQVDSLRWLIQNKYRNNRTIADLVREALDQFIEREKK